MLNTFFLTCAVVGGAIVLTELLLTILAASFGHGLHIHHHHGGGAIAHRGPIAGRMGSRIGGRVGAHGPALHRAGLAPRALPKVAATPRVAAHAKLPATKAHANTAAAGT